MTESQTEVFHATLRHLHQTGDAKVSYVVQELIPNSTPPEWKDAADGYSAYEEPVGRTDLRFARDRKSTKGTIYRLVQRVTLQFVYPD